MLGADDRDRIANAGTAAIAAPKPTKTPPTPVTGYAADAVAPLTPPRRYSRRRRRRCDCDGCSAAMSMTTCFVVTSVPFVVSVTFVVPLLANTVLEMANNRESAAGGQRRATVLEIFTPIVILLVGLCWLIFVVSIIRVAECCFTAAFAEPPPPDFAMAAAAAAAGAAAAAARK